VSDVSSVVRDIPIPGRATCTSTGLDRAFGTNTVAKLEGCRGPAAPGVSRLFSVRLRPALPKAGQYRLLGRFNYLGKTGTRSAPAADQRLQKEPRNAICGQGDTMVLPAAPETIILRGARPNGAR